MKASVTWHISEEIIACMKNGKTNDKHEPSDTGNNSEDNRNDSCKVVVQTINKVLDTIPEAMIYLEHHTDNEHLLLLHVTSNKHYVLKKKCHQLLYTYFSEVYS
jgi:hypothetical protein